MGFSVSAQETAGQHVIGLLVNSGSRPQATGAPHATAEVSVELLSTANAASTLAAGGLR